MQPATLRVTCLPAAATPLQAQQQLSPCDVQALDKCLKESKGDTQKVRVRSYVDDCRQLPLPPPPLLLPPPLVPLPAFGRESRTH